MWIKRSAKEICIRALSPYKMKSGAISYSNFTRTENDLEASQNELLRKVNVSSERNMVKCKGKCAPQN